MYDDLVDERVIQQYLHVRSLQGSLLCIMHECWTIPVTHSSNASTKIEGKRGYRDKRVCSPLKFKITWAGVTKILLASRRRIA